MASHGVPRLATTEARTEQQRQDELVKIEKYHELEHLIQSKVAHKEYTAELLALTSKLLTKNPEYYTIWNVRKRLLISGLFSNSSAGSSPSSPSRSTSLTGTTTTSTESSSSSTSNLRAASKETLLSQGPQSPGRSGTILELIQKDLVFLLPLLKQWPKCYWIWDHRIWLLQQATLRLDVKVARRLWQEELALCSMMLVRDSRNFHGWGYRRMVVAQLESPGLAGSSMVEEEFAYTTKLVHAHLSNFSAWHNRSKLIPRLLNERKASDEARKEFLDEEFDMMRNALWTDSSDQSLWFYHQFLMTTLLDPAGHSLIVPNFGKADRVKYVQDQLADIRDMLDGAEDCKWIYNALFEYTLGLFEMMQREPTDDEKRDLKDWLAEMRKLDPLRKGRWNDLDTDLGF